MNETTVQTDSAVFAALEGVTALYLMGEFGISPSGDELERASDAAVLWFEANRPEGGEEKPVCSLGLTEAILEAVGTR